jgi:hypothetical protein
MAVVVNETADPNIGRDVIRALGALVPTTNDWLHDRKDDNAHAHVKASLLGASEQIPIVDGALCSGSGRRSGSTSSTARARARSRCTCRGLGRRSQDSPSFGPDPR